MLERLDAYLIQWQLRLPTVRLIRWTVLVPTELKEEADTGPVLLPSPTLWIVGRAYSDRNVRHLWFIVLRKICVTVGHCNCSESTNIDNHRKSNWCLGSRKKSYGEVYEFTLNFWKWVRERRQDEWRDIVPTQSPQWQPTTWTTWWAIVIPMTSERSILTFVYL